MNITFNGRKTPISESFKHLSEKKLMKFDRFFDSDADASVSVSTLRENETVEVTIRSRGMVFRSEKTASDRETALDAVIDSLFKQIVKNKKKLEKRLNYVDSISEPDPAPEEYHVVKAKKFAVKPLDVDEAILQMNLVGHSFYMFRNIETGDINVIYRRSDGDYGLISPEEE